MPYLCLDPVPQGFGRNELLQLLADEVKLPAAEVGRIEWQGRRALLEMSDEWAGVVLAKLDGHTLRDRPLRVKIVAGESSAARENEHFARLGKCLDLESRAQAARMVEQTHRIPRSRIERTGYALIDLVIVDEDAGLGGRTLVRLKKRTSANLPWTRLRLGDPIVLWPDEPHEHKSPGPRQRGRDRDLPGHRGVVCDKTFDSIQVALSDMPDDLREHEVWRVDLSDDEITTQRQRGALDRARLAADDRLAELRTVLLGEKQPEFGPFAEYEWLDEGLNPSQHAAITFASAAQDIALIHGPPGTGKTRTLIEFIRQAIARGERVLAAAPSNLAVDNLCQRLVAAGENVVRLGHPARVLPELRACTLDMLVFEHPDAKLARGLVRDAQKLFRQADRFTRAKPAPGEKRAARDEARSLLRDARRLERRAVEHVLDLAPVLCGTLTGLDSDDLGRREFDWLVIDEACQAVEPSCWIPLPRVRRVIFAGDHRQLPPTVVSVEALHQGFGRSLFERLIDLFPADRVSRQLTVQYRMHDDIMNFASAEFYDATLLSDPSVASRRLCDWEGVNETAQTQIPVEFIDSAGAGYDEEREPDGESLRNPQEANIVVSVVQSLLEAGMRPDQIGVISPYAAQVRLLEELLPLAGLEVDTVDGFQGREKVAIVVSFVRSNEGGEVGFLAEVRRTNVAWTRAQSKLVLIGDSATLAHHAMYSRLLQYIETHGAYRTVWEF